jgi:hypothetical protein
MDRLSRAGFLDLRPHSHCHATPRSLFATLCTVVKPPGDEYFHLYKAYIFVAEGVCVTFERDLLVGVPGSRGGGGGQGLAQGRAADLVWRALSRGLRAAGLGRRCRELGSLHLLYEAAQEMLSLSDGALELFSRATAALTARVDAALSFQQLLAVYRTVHALRSALLMLDRHVSESHRFLAQLVDTWSPLHALAARGVLRPSSLPYLLDVADSYRHRSETLQCINAEQLSLILETLAALRNIRAIKTNTDLTLIATVFLPLTFVASIYGMVSYFTWAMQCYAMQCYVMQCYAMLCYTALCYAMAFFAMLCCDMQCNAMLCKYYAILCYAMLYYTMLYYAMQCYAMPCYAMMCYAMLCHAMLCHAMRTACLPPFLTIYIHCYCATHWLT